LLYGILIIIRDDVRLVCLRWRRIACQWWRVARVPWRLKVKPPHFGASWFTEACEDDCSRIVGDRGVVFGEGDTAIRIAEYTHTEEVVDK
jgi:hypothetical protein